MMSEFSVQLECDPARLSAIVPEWETLARRASEPNVFYEHWMLRPALEHLREPGTRITIALVRDPAGRLVGLFPLETRSRYKKLPLGQVRLWQYRHCFLCTPLVDRDHLPATLQAFYQWLRSARGFPRLMVWNGIAGEGSFFRALLAHGQGQARSAPTQRFVRALLVRQPGQTADGHIGSVLSSGHRKDLRRLEKRLGEVGCFTYDSWTDGARLDEWIEEFLELETRGWKGRQGTALKCQTADRQYFTECVRHAFAQGQLRTLEARLDGHAIASRCNFLAGDTAFSFKIAFDEAYSKYRPGLLLEVQHIRDFYGEDPRVRTLERVDYCADPGHPMLDRLSEERRPMVSIAIALRTWESLVLSVLAFAACVWGAAREVAHQLKRISARVRAGESGGVPTRDPAGVRPAPASNPKLSGRAAPAADAKAPPPAAASAPAPGAKAKSRPGAAG